MDASLLPPGPDAGPPEHARYFAALVRTTLNLSLSDGAVNEVRRHFSRFWSDALADLVSYTLLECLESRARGVSVTEREVLRAVDRVRHRLAREAQRFQNGGIAETRAEETFPPDEELGLVLSEFHTLLKTRDPRDVFLFQRHYLDGASPPAIADETGIPLSTVYRRLKAIRDEFISLRESQTRPHASD